MAGILDFIMGKDALKKAGGTAPPKKAKPEATATGLDPAAEAQKFADAKKARAKKNASAAEDAAKGGSFKRIPVSQLPTPDGIAKKFMER
jgi:hypothetical protein